MKHPHQSTQGLQTSKMPRITTNTVTLRRENFPDTQTNVLNRKYIGESKRKKASKLPYTGNEITSNNHQKVKDEPKQVEGPIKTPHKRIVTSDLQKKVDAYHAKLEKIQEKLSQSNQNTVDKKKLPEKPTQQHQPKEVKQPYFKTVDFKEQRGDDLEKIEVQPEPS